LSDEPVRKEQEIERPCRSYENVALYRYSPRHAVREGHPCRNIQPFEVLTDRRFAIYCREARLDNPFAKQNNDRSLATLSP
jgi:hypothetical protein